MRKFSKFIRIAALPRLLIEDFEKFIDLNDFNCKFWRRNKRKIRKELRTTGYSKEDINLLFSCVNKWFILLEENAEILEIE